MPDKYALKIYAATLVAFLAVDGLWIGLVAGSLFKSEVGTLLRPDPKLPPAIMFYLIYPAAITVLAVLPSARERSTQSAAWRGAVLGLAAYATFDLTNLSIVRDWTVLVTVVDLSWGTIATAVASLAGYWAACWSGRNRTSA